MRIIAGEYRGRKIHCPKEGTRPTMDRVREALFSILGDIRDQTAVDLYAGSGAMGIEAVSRGAARALLVESDRAAAAVIRKNLSALGCERARVIHASVEESRRFLQAVAPIDLVLCDPPWPIAQEAALLVAKTLKGLLAPSARVVIGHPADQPLELPAGSGLTPQQDRRWGGSALLFCAPETTPTRDGASSTATTADRTNEVAGTP